MDHYQYLLVYKKAYTLAMDVFEISKSFPKEEKYSLTDQIRRSSRSVCTNLAEAFRRKKYLAHFISKITDSDAENAETGVWLDFSNDCGYLNNMKFESLKRQKIEIGNLLGDILKFPQKYL